MVGIILMRLDKIRSGVNGHSNPDGLIDCYNCGTRFEKWNFQKGPSYKNTCKNCVHNKKTIRRIIDIKAFYIK